MCRSTPDTGAALFRFCLSLPMNLPVLAALSALVASGLATEASAQFIVAHRGASFDAPENTLAAFRLAWEQGADAIEGDFYLTADNQIVCLHDTTTKRVAPGQAELAVSEATVEQLRSLDVGRWKHSRFAGERIPTLAEVLATVPEGRRIFVEIKCGPEILPVLKEQLRASRLAPQQVTIICFKAEVISAARRLMPEYEANWLTSYRRITGESDWSPAVDDVVATLKQTQATGLGSNGNQSVLTADFVKALRQAGFALHVWTVNDPQAARTFKALGVASITTDRPTLIREHLQP